MNKRGGIFYDIARLPAEMRVDAWARVKASAEYPSLRFNWRGAFARPEQIIDYTDGNVLLETCRRWGKTRALVEHMREEVAAGRATSIGVIAPKYAHLRDVIGAAVVKAFPPDERPAVRDGGRRFIFPNGAQAHGFSSEAIVNVRGHEFDLLIGDEIAYWENPMATWQDAAFALSLTGARWVCGTTPPVDPTQAGAIAFMRFMRGQCDRRVGGKFGDNVFQPAAERRQMEASVDRGSARWRAEVLGEPVEQPEGALWHRDDFKPMPQPPPPFDRVVVAVDPAGSAGDTADETGIAVVGRAGDNAYVLADGSGHYTPDEWARRVADLYSAYDADVVIIERNYGGDMAAHTLRVTDYDMPIEEVHAKRGKYTRADPVSRAYKNGYVYHAAGLDALEQQMLDWSPLLKGNAVDDRVDAVVYAVTNLLIGRSGIATWSDWG